MNRHSKIVLNRNELALERRLAPHIEVCTGLLIEGGKATKVSRQSLEVAPKEDWLVLKDSQGTGFAVCGCLAYGQMTAIQKHISRVSTLRAISRVCRSSGEQRLELRDELHPPREWAFFQVMVAQGAVWCAISVDPPLLPIVVEETQSGPFTRARVLGSFSCEVFPGVGESMVIQEIRVTIPEFHIKSRLLFEKERGMAIEVVSLGEQEEQIVPGVRIDLGEIEISLADIIGIRSGSVIRLGPGGPHRCFLRIGSSTLAEGEVLTEGDALRVTITRVI